MRTERSRERKWTYVELGTSQLGTWPTWHFVNSAVGKFGIWNWLIRYFIIVYCFKLIKGNFWFAICYKIFHQINSLRAHCAHTMNEWKNGKVKRFKNCSSLLVYLSFYTFVLFWHFLSLFFATQMIYGKQK